MPPLDLHGIFRDSKAIAQALGSALDEAIRTKQPTLEIIPGKGSGELRRHVLRFLHQPHIRGKYKTLSIDERNRGLIVVTF